MDIQMWELLCPPPVSGEITGETVCAVSGPLAPCRSGTSHIVWARRFLLSPRDLLSQVAFRGGLKLQPWVASQEHPGLGVLAL